MVGGITHGGIIAAGCQFARVARRGQSFLFFLDPSPAICLNLAMKCLWIIIACFATSVLGEPILLWPDSAGSVSKETVKENWSKEHPNRHVSKVRQPTIEFYPAASDKNTGAAVVICPGGGYHILAWDHEGVKVAEWLNSIGVNALLLKYRVPAKRGGELVGFAPLQDAQRAIRMTRLHAKKWNIDSNRVGILGFSAGGNLSILASTHYATKSYPLAGEVDAMSARPDFSILVYAAYCYDKETGSLMENIPVDGNTPPAFLVHAQNDPIDPMCSIAYYAALTQHKVPAELHVYPKGGHGYGMWNNGHNVNSWPVRCAEWMAEIGIIVAGGRN